MLGSGIAALDATVVNIALPVIGRDFHTGISALQWVMTSYILSLTAFLLIGGSLQRGKPVRDGGSAHLLLLLDEPWRTSRWSLSPAAPTPLSR